MTPSFCRIAIASLSLALGIACGRPTMQEHQSGRAVVESTHTSPSLLLPLQPTGIAGPPIHRAAPLGISRMAWAGSHLKDTLDRVFVTDPDHDSVWVIPEGTSTHLLARQRIELSPGSEPGDIAISYRANGSDFDARAYVSVHSAGELLSIPVDSPADFNRISVCAQPRGVDSLLDAKGAWMVYVVCADGVFMTIDPSTDTVVSSIPIEDDLKDVVMYDHSTALITRLRTADILQLDVPSGKFTQIAVASPAGFSPDVAWQMVPIDPLNRMKGAVVAHQFALTTAISVGATGVLPPTDPCASGDCSGAGADAGEGVPPPEGIDAGTPCGDFTNQGCAPGQQGYGSSMNGCFTGVAAPTVTVLTESGPGPTIVASNIGVFEGLVAPLQVAVIPGGDGNAMLLGIGNGQQTQFSLAQTQQIPVDAPPGPTCVTGENFVDSAVAAMSYKPDAIVVGQTLFYRQHGQLAGSVQFPRAKLAPEPQPAGRTALDFEPIKNEVGRDLFHSATPSFMSCASCHPSGRDDGHTWNFNPMGARRTPSLGGGLLSTAPFHWDGAETDISQLMVDVFVGRMEGPAPTPDQIDALSGWLDSIPVAHAHSAPEASLVAAGKTLFESPAVGCTSCHSGAHFTNNATLDVGTGGAFQVPSLLGVGSRPPYLHSGCAATLEDRFGPCGGGDLHGTTSQLSASELKSLVAYLQSL